MRHEASSPSNFFIPEPLLDPQGGQGGPGLPVSAPLTLLRSHLAYAASELGLGSLEAGLGHLLGVGRRWGLAGDSQGQECLTLVGCGLSQL